MSIDHFNRTVANDEILRLYPSTALNFNISGGSALLQRRLLETETFEDVGTFEAGAYTDIVSCHAEFRFLFSNGIKVSISGI
ncbi:MAG: hypothetical protein AAF621_00455 [Pseudomonadota bacterium]